MGAVLWLESHFISDKAIHTLRESEKALQESYRRAGLPGVISEVERESRSFRTGGDALYYLLVDGSGQHLAGRLMEIPVGRFSESPQLFWTTKEFLRATHEDEPTYWPGVLIPFPDGSQCFISLHYELGEEIREIALPTLLLSILITLIWSSILSVSLNRTLYSRVAHVNQVIYSYQKGDLSKRLDTSAVDDEFEALSSHLNSLFENLERLIIGMRRVTADVAHDLRSPLTRVKTRFEVTLLSEREPEEYVEVLEESLEDVSRLVDVFNSLLKLGQLEAKKEPFERKKVDLNDIVSKLSSLFQGTRLEVESDDNCYVMGNTDLLLRMLSNLVENALKFSPEEQPVRLSVRRVNGEIAIYVQDRGPGIPAEKHGLVTERFYRGDRARSTPGNGLGLSLVKAVVDNLDGKLLLEDNAPGLRVVVRLSAVSEDE